MNEAPPERSDETAEDRPADRGGAGRALSRAVARSRARTQALRALGMVLVMLLGSAIGAALAPPVSTQVGPLEAEVRVRPEVDGGVRLLLPPAGEVVFDTHSTPVTVQASVKTVDLTAARTLLGSPAALRTLEASAPQSLRDATIRAALYAAGSSLLGAGALAVLVYRRRWRRTAVVVATVVGMLGALTGATVLTFAPERFAQPRFTGLLSQAPYVAGQTGSVLDRLESYRSGVGDIVQAVTTLYAMSGQLPVVPASGVDGDVVTVLHVSDLHLNPIGFDLSGARVPRRRRGRHRRHHDVGE